MYKFKVGFNENDIKTKDKKHIGYLLKNSENKVIGYKLEKENGKYCYRDREHFYIISDENDICYISENTKHQKDCIRYKDFLERTETLYKENQDLFIYTSFKEFTEIIYRNCNGEDFEEIIKDITVDDNHRDNIVDLRNEEIDEEMRGIKKEDIKEYLREEYNCYHLTNDDLNKIIENIETDFLEDRKTIINEIYYDVRIFDDIKDFIEWKYDEREDYVDVFDNVLNFDENDRFKLEDIFDLSDLIELDDGKQLYIMD